MKHIELSVIIPTFNSILFLPALFQCIDSLILPISTELIFVDDCSSDDTLQVLYEYAAKKSYCKIIPHRVNKGPACARNTGIEVSVGNYLFFMDSDDLISIDIFKVLFESLYTYDSLPDVVCCDTKWILASGRNTREDNYLYSDDVLFEEADISLALADRFYNLDKKGILDCKGKIIKSSLLHVNSIRFDTDLRYLEDEVFFWDLLAHASSVLYVRNQLYEYSVNESINTAVVQGLLRGFSMDSLIIIKEHSLQMFLARNFSSEKSEILSRQVFVYFAINVLISCAKSIYQKKISEKNGIAFVRSMVSDLLSSDNFHSAFSDYTKCSGESRLLLFAFKLKWSALIELAVFRRSRKIVSQANRIASL